MSELKLYSQEEMMNLVIGPVGTPKRDVFESKLAAELEAYKIGEALKKARKEQHLTQKKLGEMVGVKEAQISKIENGKSVAFTTIIRLFKALGAKTACLDLGNMGKVALW
ncbi:MAG: helix-turn-helix transcriptional regulator [Muribaculaceae bacterium]|nr:helix-turn-helix transcriptional regulator [Muribaculaceae bacterium]